MLKKERKNMKTQKGLSTCTRSSLARRNRNSSVTVTVHSMPSGATKSSAIFKNDHVQKFSLI